MKENNDVSSEKNKDDQDEEELLETCELYISILIKNVEDFKKNNNPDMVALDNFMSTYCEVESNIITNVQKCHFKEGSYRYNKMLELIEKFNPYFGEYQDTWDQRYLEAYKKFAKKKYMDSSNDMMMLSSNKETAEILEGNDFLSNNENLNIEEENKENKNFDLLNKIDEELDKVEDVSEIEEKEKKGKSRDSCLECILM